MGQKSIKHATDILTRELNGPQAQPLYMSLHESDPGAEGDQSTFEVSYPGYHRVEIPAGAWEVSKAQARNIEQVLFPVAQGRGPTARWFSIGTSETGPGEMLRRGRLTSPTEGLEIVPGMMPVARPGSLTLTEG